MRIESHTDGSYSGSVIFEGDSCCPLHKVRYGSVNEHLATYCHGLLVRCGETRSQLPRSGLYLRWDMSSRICSGILKKKFEERNVEN
jgi:hypothetical protein